MNEGFLRQVAHRFGLEVLKRVTAGNDARHFATFELGGKQAQVELAWETVRPHARRGCDKLDFGDNPGHPDFGKVYIRCESVWCEVALDAAEVAKTTIASEFAELWQKTGLDAGQHAVQHQEMRRAFYAGFFSALMLANRAAGALGEEASVDKLQALHNEATEFYADVQAGRA